MEDVGIRPERADSKVSSMQIFEKIKKHIDKSKFIIAKVDEDNLNVFFELGLAMGAKKEVLLISEESLVLKLPSDLKNWECLVYPKGNYDVLKNRVSDYFMKNFYYTKK